MAVAFLMVSSGRRRDVPRRLWSNPWAVAAVVAVVAGGLLPAAAARNAGPDQALAQYLSMPQFDIPSQPSDALIGPPDGRIRVVVFSSFQCPWCRAFAPEVHYLAERFGRGLTIVFKHYPLDRACNPAIATEMQPRACAAAWAAEAANLQNAFWRYHDGLFAGSLSDSEAMLAAEARLAGLDFARWDRDRESAMVRAHVLRDISLGIRLGIEGTPAVFLDGRRVPNPTLAVLDTLIREEMRAAGIRR